MDIHIRDFVLAFFTSFGLALLGTWAVKKIALRYGIVDVPHSNGRKLHVKTTPLLGGLAVFFAFALTSGIFWPKIIQENIIASQLAGLLLAGGVIMIGGFFDDKYNIRAKYQLLFPTGAILVLIIGGLGVSYIRNPFGELLFLDVWKIPVSWRGNIYDITILADIFLFVWVLGMSYSTKLLDGLDGLVSGITVIGSLILFFLSITKEVNQPNTALLTIIVAGSFLGFLVWNYHPAKIFLGEGGSLLAGFLLGTLAVLGGAKLATALLIMGIPALDMGWVIIKRLFIDKKNPFHSADRRHLHFRLLDGGFSHRQAVHILYALTAIFGVSGLFLKGRGKFFALAVVAITTLLLGGWLVKKYHENETKKGLDRNDKIQ